MTELTHGRGYHTATVTTDTRMSPGIASLLSASGKKRLRRRFVRKGNPPQPVSHTKLRARRKQERLNRKRGRR